jgi:hypothetical protein
MTDMEKVVVYTTNNEEKIFVSLCLAEGHDLSMNGSDTLFISYISNDNNNHNIIAIDNNYMKLLTRTAFIISEEYNDVNFHIMEYDPNIPKLIQYDHNTSSIWYHADISMFRYNGMKSYIMIENEYQCVTDIFYTSEVSHA